MKESPSSRITSAQGRGINVQGPKPPHGWNAVGRELAIVIG
jgi:hypothetical protein